MAKEQTDSKEQVVDIDSLRQDTHNFNRGTEEGQQLMERSFKELGAGRSILLDREGNIIAGNKSQEAARKAGIKRVRIVETTGDELVAVKRTAGTRNGKLHGNRGSIAPRNYFSRASNAHVEQVMQNLANKIDAKIEELVNSGKMTGL